MTLKTGILFVVLLAGCLAVPAPRSELDQSSFFEHVDRSSRIVGGTPAAVGTVPYMGSLSQGLLIRNLVCGASIIYPRYVLTAAHCIAAVFSGGSLASTLRVTVGTNQWNLGGVSYTLQRNVTHEHYVSSIIKNDIGLLVTNEDIVFTNLISSVPLSFNYVPGGVRVRAAGYGRIAAGGAISSQLLEVEVTTLGGQQCVDDVQQAAIDLNMIPLPVDPTLELCTYHAVGYGMCNGDSGSALVQIATGEQVGLVSWGFPCAIGAPDMFVRVSAYREWLSRHIV